MVMIGRRYIPPDIIDVALGRELLPQDKAMPARFMQANLNLSPRQQQIMRCVHMVSSTNKMIAKVLGIS